MIVSISQSLPFHFMVDDVHQDVHHHHHHHQDLTWTKWNKCKLSHICPRIRQIKEDVSVEFTISLEYMEEDNFFFSLASFSLRSLSPFWWFIMQIWVLTNVIYIIYINCAFPPFGFTSNGDTNSTRFVPSFSTIFAQNWQTYLSVTCTITSWPAIKAHYLTLFWFWLAWLIIGHNTQDCYRPSLIYTEQLLAKKVYMNIIILVWFLRTWTFKSLSHISLSLSLPSYLFVFVFLVW